MQNFDEDMGELFRKASAEIRLKPLEDDWEKIKKSLFPEPVFLPPTGSGINRPHVFLEAMIAFFIVGVVAISSIVFKDHKTNKIAPGVQFGYGQSDGPRGRPPVQFEKRAQNRNIGLCLNSVKPFTTIPAENAVTAPQSEWISLNMMVTARKENLIQVDPDQTPYVQKISTNPVEVSKEKAIGKEIYGGIIAGPQFSQTKQQGFGNAGLSVGLIAGFRFNKHLSIETGFTLSDKQFSSAGEYFDMSKIAASMPSGMRLLQIHSTSTVWEIPFNINYEFLKLKKGRIFANGGISSYIITSERNQYQVSVNGTNETLRGNYSVRQSYFAATANIGLGYEWNAAKGLSLRVNPYVQIPLKMIGMGSMPVVSTGIYLGILFPLIK